MIHSIDAATSGYSNETFHDLSHSVSHSNYDHRSDLHNIILGSLTLALTVSTFVLGFLRWLQKRHLGRSVLRRIDAEGHHYVVQLIPMSEAYPLQRPHAKMSLTPFPRLDPPSCREVIADHSTADSQSQIAEENSDSVFRSIDTSDERTNPP